MCLTCLLQVSYGIDHAPAAIASFQANTCDVNDEPYNPPGFRERDAYKISVSWGFDSRVQEYRGLQFEVAFTNPWMLAKAGCTCYDVCLAAS